MSSRLSKCLLIAAGLLLCGTNARAQSLEAATAAYGKRDFAAAHRGFLALARIGNGEAQYNLAVMLLNGEGVTRNVREGYAWLLCAQDYGIADAEPLIAQIAAQVKPEVTARARECVSMAGKAAALALVPRLPARDYWSNNHGPTRLGKPVSVFPDSAHSGDNIGWVEAELTIDVDGRVKDVWIFDSYPTGQFDVYALDAIRGLKHTPAIVGGKAAPVMTRMRWKYGFKGFDARDIQGIGETLKRLTQQAEAGAPTAQYVLYRLGDSFAELRPGIDWLGFGRKALDGGFVAARFQGGYCAVVGVGDCLITDRAAGLDMVREAALTGTTTAQVALGRLAFAEGTDDGYARAVRWLEAARTKDDPWAARYLAAALLAFGDPARRDAPRAIALLEPLLATPLMRDDPAVWQLAAVAYAQTGKPDLAVGAQEKAIVKAKRYDWPLEDLEVRRAAYAGGSRDFAGSVLVVSARVAPVAVDPSMRDGRVCHETPRGATRITRCD